MPSSPGNPPANHNRQLRDQTNEAKHNLFPDHHAPGRDWHDRHGAVFGCISGTAQPVQSATTQSATSQPATNPSLLQTLAQQFLSPQAVVNEGKIVLNEYNKLVAAGVFTPNSTEVDTAVELQTALDDVDAADPSDTNFQQLVNDVAAKGIALAITSATHKSTAPASKS